MSEAHQKGSFALSAIGAQIGKHGRQKKKKKKKKKHRTQNSMFTIYKSPTPSKYGGSIGHSF